LNDFCLSLNINIIDMVKDSGTSPEEIITLPRTLAEFQDWEPNDDFNGVGYNLN
jgi:hypothetical protein